MGVEIRKNKFEIRISKFEKKKISNKEYGILNVEGIYE